MAGSSAMVMSQAGMSAPGAGTANASDAGASAPPKGADGEAQQQPADAAQTADDTAPSTLPGVPGKIDGLTLSLHENPLRAHTWVKLHMLAASSALPLHAYEVRVATEPIVDEQSFLRNGRQAKTATDAKEGPSYLQLPTDVAAGESIDTNIGDLSEDTHYYIGVRAKDVNNRAGPLAFAEITTPRRTFATVTPCFIASVAYGSPLAQEVGSLRRLRDRYLLSNALGRGWVTAYYEVGGAAAGWLAPHPSLRRALRAVLSPLVALAQRLD
jgi:hypothetical protein